jgi:acid phosphatase type 7
VWPSCNGRGEGPTFMEEARHIVRGSMLLLTAAAAMLLAYAGTALPQERTPHATLVGAGDIASCNYDRDKATAKLLGNIPGTVFTLGDNVYPDGTARQFRNCYDPTWGKYKRRTKPSVGNHEYHTPHASGYFDYFRARAGGSRQGILQLQPRELARHRPQ